MLILVIGIAIILYILMLPPDDRADLLGENRSYISDGIHKLNITVLLAKEPGTLQYLAEDTVEIDIPSFNLFTKKDAVVLVEFDSIYLSKSLFNYVYRNVTFPLRETENIDNFVMSFSAPKHEGVLTITLNGNIIMSRELRNANPEPLRLPAEYLEQMNTLEFSVSGPGMNFWESNEYTIENIKLTADVTDFSGQENRQTFLVSKQEKSLLEEGILNFVIDCDVANSAPLQIFLNNRDIYSGVPDCGTRMRLPPIPSDRILEGENTLRFRSEQGFYIIYNIEMQLNLEKPIYPTYYFTIEEGDMWEHVDDMTADFNVTLVFSEGEEYKKGEIWLNGHITEIETRDLVYTRKLNQYARKGNNAIEIRPRSEKLEVTELQVVFAE